jgi:hypothetical protein
MNWKTWTKISAVILFIIAVTTFYLNYIQKDEARLEFQNFPTLLTSIIGDDLEFNFFLYNSGDRPAFVDSLVILRYEYDAEESVIYPVDITPSGDFSVDGKGYQQITVSLPYEKDGYYYLQTDVYYDDLKLSSEKIPVLFGEMY